jgi:cytochrome c biogenesis protein
VTDLDGNQILDEALPLGEFNSRTNPDAPAAVLDIPPAGAQLTVIAPDANPANQPELDLLNLRSGQMYLQVRPLNAASPLSGVQESVIGQSDTVELGNMAVTFVREKRFTVLQVARNPGIPIFIAASLLLVGGLGVTFYFPHRRIRGIVTPTPGGAVAALAPMARRDWSAQRVFAQVVDGLERSLPVTVERIERDLPEPVDRRRPLEGPLASQESPA